MDRPRTARPVVRLVAGVTTVLATLAVTTGCTATNPQTTQVAYDPSDGENVIVGSLRALSLMVVTAGGSAPGAFVARLVNTSGDPLTVTVSGRGGTDLDATFQVPAGQTLRVGPDQDESATVATVGAQPGELVTVQVQVAGGDSTSIAIPVISSSLPEYATLTPSATPTATPTPSQTATGPAAKATPSSGSSVTAQPSRSPSGGASLSPSAVPRTLSPSGTPTG